MMTTKTILISVMMCMNLLVSTTFSQVQPKQAPKATTQTLTIADNNKVVRVSTGTTLVIQLEENPSTGYAWHFQNLNAKAFKTLDDQIVSKPENKDLNGAPSTRTITLKAQTKGKHHLILNYYRGWENPNTATQTFKLTINAK
jgi:inhibitor of cysteine peptidase